MIDNIILLLMWKKWKINVEYYHGGRRSAVLIYSEIFCSMKRLKSISLVTALMFWLLFRLLLNSCGLFEFKVRVTLKRIIEGLYFRSFWTDKEYHVVETDHKHWYIVVHYLTINKEGYCCKVYNPIIHQILLYAPE